MGPGSYVCLSITDTGEGMDAETQKRVFEPFFTTKGAGRGTGLGLATVEGIVKQSGGEIVLESEKGRGTSVTIYLPRVDESDGQSPKVASPSPAIRETGTILLVEDEQTVREYVREVLQGNGYNVIAAADGVKALGLPEEQIRQVDLLLTDVIMPNLSGPDLAKRLWETRPDLRVVFMSGHPGSHLEGLGMPRKGFRFIAKPFLPEALMRTVRAILDDQPPHAA